MYLKYNVCMSAVGVVGVGMQVRGGGSRGFGCGCSIVSQATELF